ncbi:MAG: IS21 family transposase [Pseudomonadota bacterium]|nr:IS21 family transposase [Pseudomonadota bacterium]
MHQLQELVRLHRLGTGAREVARLLGVSPNTEREYRIAFTKAGLLEGPVDDLPTLEALKATLPRVVPRQQTSTVEDWTSEVKRLVGKGCEARAIHDHLHRERPDFTGSYYAVKRLVKRLRVSEGVKAGDVVIPVITDAGDVAQVDFGYVGYLFDPETNARRKAWVFVMVLGHSRHQFARVVFDQRSETWLRLHVLAFAFFGGVPWTIVPDNLKAAVVRCAFGLGEDPGLHRSYVELARFYGFKVDPAPPRDPQKKGKVESGVKYVSGNFFDPRDDGEDITVVNDALTRWVLETAGRRIHGTTGLRPIEVFEAEEKPLLKGLPPLCWVATTWRKAKVHRDTHVAFDKRYYSVPWPHIGKDAWVRATPDAVDLYVEDARVAMHARHGKGAWSTEEAHLPAGRSELRNRSRSHWEGRARVLGDEVAAWVTETYDGADALSPLRTVQAVITLLEAYPRERADKACKRARHFGISDYRGLKDILRNALDLEPLPVLLIPALATPLTAPRFARPLSQLLASYRKVSNDVH